MSFKGYAITLILLVTFSVIIYAAFILHMTWPVSEFSIEKAGQFGDSFGVLTALFSGLAFSGLIITILLQRKELELQREELKLTRQELSKTSNAQQEQVQQLKEAANLNALCTLSQVYTDMSLEQRHAKSVSANSVTPLREEYLEKLKIMVDKNV